MPKPTILEQFEEQLQRYVELRIEDKDFNRNWFKGNASLFFEPFLDSLHSQLIEAMGEEMDELGHKDRPFYGTVAARSYAKAYNQHRLEALAAIDKLFKKAI